uniref:Chemokine interleukin-8-like domain-containing protein n=1 Tax=Oryzias latipes TaxID=8090 RepID=A0A3P9JZ48_ORYLA
MKLNPQLICQLALLSLLCLLQAVRETDGVYVPGRCLCPQTIPGVRGRLEELLVLPRSASCNTITVIVTMMNNARVCLNPEQPMAKQLIRCWDRSERLGLDKKRCLKRRRVRKGGRQQRQRRRGQGLGTNISSSASQ